MLSCLQGALCRSSTCGQSSCVPGTNMVYSPHLCEDAVHNHESKKRQNPMNQVQLQGLISITANGDLQLKV